MAKKKPKRKVWMKFFNLRLNEEDLSYLRFVLENEMEMQQDLMKSPHPDSSTPEEKLEDFVVARDMYADALKIVQMIDRVCPGLRGPHGGK